MFCNLVGFQQKDVTQSYLLTISVATCLHTNSRDLSYMHTGSYRKSRMSSSYGLKGVRTANEYTRCIRKDKIAVAYVHLINSRNLHA